MLGLEVLVTKPGDLSLISGTHGGRRRELTPKNYLLTSTHTMIHTHVHVHSYIHIHVIKTSF